MFGAAEEVVLFHKTGTRMPLHESRMLAIIYIMRLPYVSIASRGLLRRDRGSSMTVFSVYLLWSTQKMRLSNNLYRESCGVQLTRL